MNKTNTLIISVFVAVVATVGITTAVLVNQPQPNQQTTNQEAPAENNNSNYLVSFVADPGKSVLDQLKEKAMVETKDSSLGPYVDSINGVVSGTDGKYWTYYVDGQMAQIGAGEFKTEGGEFVEWKFE